MSKKKIVLIVMAIVLVILSMFILMSCNKQVFDFEYKFDKAYVKIGDEWVNIDVKSWSDYEGEQLQLSLKDGTVMVVSSVNCILYKGALPRK